MANKDRLAAHVANSKPGALVSLADVGDPERDPNHPDYRGEVVVRDDAPEHVGHDPAALDDEDKIPPESALAELLTALGEDDRAAKCMVWRIGEGDAEDSFLYEVSAKDFMARGGISDMSRRYGPGIYRIRVYRAGKIYTHKRVKIGASLIPEMPAATGGDSNSAALFALIAAMKESNEKILQAIAKPAPTISDYLKDLNALQMLVPKPPESAREESPLKRIKETVELMNMVSGLRGETGGARGSGESAWSRLAERFLPNILEKLEKVPPPAKPAIPHPRAVPVVPAPAVVESEAAPVILDDSTAVMGEDEEMLKQFRMKMALDFLVSAAGNNLPVSTYADLALDQVPAEELSALLNRDDWANALAVYDARVSSFPEWFRKLREEILAGVAEMQAASAQSAVANSGEGGDTPGS